VATVPHLLTAGLETMVIIFWLSVSMTILAFFNVACRNPGYVKSSGRETEPNFVSSSSFAQEFDIVSDSRFP
jgi:hypothetical protein